MKNEDQETIEQKKHPLPLSGGFPPMPMAAGHCRPDKQFQLYDGHKLDERALLTEHGYTDNDLDRIAALAIGETYILDASGAAGKLTITRIADLPEQKQHATTENYL